MHYVSPTGVSLWCSVSTTLSKKQGTIWLGTVAHVCNPSTLEDWGGWISRSRDQDHPGRHGETLSLPKMQILAGRGGACLLSQLLRRLRQENHLNPGGGDCSDRDSITALQPGRESENQFWKKKEGWRPIMLPFTVMQRNEKPWDYVIHT